MNKKTLSFVMLAVGAAIGSAATWKIVKTKYEKIAQEEIDSVKFEYSRLMSAMKKKLNESVEYTEDSESDEEDDDEDSEEERCIENENDEVVLTEYNAIAGMYRVGFDDDDEKNEREGGTEDEVPYINGPYVISPEEFGSEPGYNAQPLDYFSDGVLADSWGVQLNIDETIGDDALNHFGEYNDDIVYVRNERTELDYEVTRDPRTYEEAMRTNPYYGE